MKQLFLILSCLGLICTNCSKIEEVSQNSDNSIFVSSDEADAIALKHIELEEDQYVLNMTSAQAGAHGISSSDYTRIVNEMQVANHSIKNWQQTGANYTLTDPKLISIQSRANTEATPTNIVIVTRSGGEIGIGKIQVPSNKGLSISCWSNGLFQVHSIWIFNGVGRLAHSQVGVGVAGTWSYSLDIQGLLFVKYKATNSGGGYCSLCSKSI